MAAKKNALHLPPGRGELGPRLDDVLVLLAQHLLWVLEQAQALLVREDTQELHLVRQVAFVRVTDVHRHRPCPLLAGALLVFGTGELDQEDLRKRVRVEHEADRAWIREAAQGARVPHDDVDVVLGNLDLEKHGERA